MLRGNNCTEAAKQQIFRFNPGKELKIFPDKHPYYKAPETAKKELFFIAKREAQKRAKPVIREATNLTTGQLTQTRKAMQRAYGHAFNQEEFAMYDYIVANIDKLVFKSFSPLGEGKDLTNPKDKKNIKNKRDRGVTGYNAYSIIVSGIEWQVKTEVYKNKNEAVYHILKKETK